MKIQYSFLVVNGIRGLASSAMPPLIALLVTQSISMESLALCLLTSAALRFALTPIVAPLVDNSNPLKIIFFCEFSSAIFSAILAFTLWTNTINLVFWISYFALTAVAQAFEGTAIPKISVKLVSNNELNSFIGLESAVMYSTRMIGPIMGGISLLIWKPDEALMAILTLPALIAVPLSYFLLLTVGSKFQTSAIENSKSITETSAEFSDWLKNVSNGFRMRWSIATERFVALQVFLELLFVIPTFGIVLPRIIIENQWANSWLGWLEASSGAGLVAGALLAPRLLRIINAWVLCVSSAIFLSIFVCISGLFISYNNGYGLAALLFLANFSLSLRIQAGASQRRVAVPEFVRAQFAGSNITLNAFATQVGVVCATAWVIHYDSATWFYLSSACLFILSLTIMLVPGLRKLMELNVSDAVDFYLYTYPDVFKNKKQLQK